MTIDDGMVIFSFTFKSKSESDDALKYQKTGVSHVTVLCRNFTHHNIKKDLILGPTKTH